MSIYPNVTEQDSKNLRILAEEQKNQQAIKNKNKILKQTHDVKIAENLSPTTKKLQEVNEGTKKLGNEFKKAKSENEMNQEIIPVVIDSEDENDNTQSDIDALPKSNILSIPMMEMWGALMNRRNSLKLKQDDSSRPSILRIPFQTWSDDTMQINVNNFDLTPEIFKALSSASYTGKTMRKYSDILLMNNIKNDLDYTGLGGKPSKRKNFLLTDLPKKVAEIEDRIVNEEVYEYLQGEGVKIIIPSNIIDSSKRWNWSVGGWKTLHALR